MSKSSLQELEMKEQVERAMFRGKIVSKVLGLPGQKAVDGSNLLLELHLSCEFPNAKCQWDAQSSDESSNRNLSPYRSFSDNLRCTENNNLNNCLGRMTLLQARRVKIKFSAVIRVSKEQASTARAKSFRANKKTTRENQKDGGVYIRRRRRESP